MAWETGRGRVWSGNGLNCTPPQIGRGVIDYDPKSANACRCAHDTWLLINAKRIDAL